MTHICTFPDYSRVPVQVKDQNETQILIGWESKLGKVSTVWVPAEWVSLRVHPATLSA